MWAALLQLESSLPLLQPRRDSCSWILQQPPSYNKWDKARVTCLEPGFVVHQNNSKASRWLRRLNKVHPPIIRHKWLILIDEKRQLVFRTRGIGITLCFVFVCVCRLLFKKFSSSCASFCIFLPAVLHVLDQCAFMSFGFWQFSHKYLCPRVNQSHAFHFHRYLGWGGLDKEGDSLLW